MGRGKSKAEGRVSGNHEKRSSSRTARALRQRFESIEHIAEIHHACVLDTLEGTISTSQGNIVLRGTAQTLRAAELQARHGGPRRMLDKLIGPPAGAGSARTA
jgi:hypothetical protein